MQPIHVAEEFPDVSIEQRTSDEWTKLVRKLRWMGLDEEAERTRCLLSWVVPVDPIPAGNPSPRANPAPGNSGAAASRRPRTGPVARIAARASARSARDTEAA